MTAWPLLGNRVHPVQCCLRSAYCPPPHRRTPMPRLALLVPPLAAVLLLWPGPAPADDKPSDEGFTPIFNGKDLTGWKVSAKTGHSGKSKHTSGGKWVVEDGAIVGSQDVPGNGGIIITDKPYKNFEIVLEMNNDFGPDSGLFLRSTEDGTAYQALIDYHATGSLMGIYGEGKLGGRPHVRNFDFLNSPDKIKEHEAKFKLPVSAEKWPSFWKHGSW